MGQHGAHTVQRIYRFGILRKECSNTAPTLAEESSRLEGVSGRNWENAIFSVRHDPLSETADKLSTMSMTQVTQVRGTVGTHFGPSRCRRDVYANGPFPAASVTARLWRLDG